MGGEDCILLFLSEKNKLTRFWGALTLIFLNVSHLKSRRSSLKGVVLNTKINLKRRAFILVHLRIFFHRNLSKSN